MRLLALPLLLICACPNPAGVLDAGGEGDSGVDAGSARDAGLDGGADAGPRCGRAHRLPNCRWGAHPPWVSTTCRCWCRSKRTWCRSPSWCPARSTIAWLQNHRRHDVHLRTSTASFRWLPCASTSATARAPAPARASTPPPAPGVLQPVQTGQARDADAARLLTRARGRAAVGALLRLEALSALQGAGLQAPSAGEPGLEGRTRGGAYAQRLGRAGCGGIAPRPR